MDGAPAGSLLPLYNAFDELEIMIKAQESARDGTAKAVDSILIPAVFAAKGDAEPSRHRFDPGRAE